MAFAKFPKAKDPNFLVHKFGSMFRGVAAPSEILEVFLNRPHLLLDNRWDEWITQIKPAFTIKFKEILFGNLNKKISAYLGVKESQEIDDFILRYRIINKKYISY